MNWYNLIKYVKPQTNKKKFACPPLIILSRANSIGVRLMLELIWNKDLVTTQKKALIIRSTECINHLKILYMIRMKD